MIQLDYNIHPAKQIPFQELYDGLEQECLNRNVFKKMNRNLIIYSYSSSCAYEKKWNIYTLCARGLILDVANKKIVALPFPKFFNYSELENFILPNEPFECFDKIDGSLAVIYYYENQWNIATKGAFASDQAIWAKNWFDSHINQKNMHKDYTYLAEIVYHENRIVVNYDIAGLFLLGAYDVVCGQEIDINYLFEQNDNIGFFTPKKYEFQNIADAVENIQTWDASREGVVVRYQSGLRLKVKGGDYCRLHRIISGCTPLAVWEAMRDCQDIEQMRKHLPEEFRADIDTIVSIFEQKYEKNLTILKEDVERFADLDDKSLGILLNNKFAPINPVTRSFIFACRKYNFFEQIKQSCKMRTNFFNLFRPTANVLPGYAPTSAMNRFQNSDN